MYSVKSGKYLIIKMSRYDYTGYMQLIDKSKRYKSPIADSRECRRRVRQRNKTL